MMKPTAKQGLARPLTYNFKELTMPL